MMSEVSELRQSVLDAAGKGINALLVYLVPGVTALASFFKVVEPILAGFTMIASLVMAYLHFKRRDKIMLTKDRLMEAEIELKEAQIEAISTRKEERIDLE